MFHILGFLFIIIIAVILIGLTIIGSVLRALFGFGKRSTPRNNNNSSNKERRYYKPSGETEKNNKEEEIITEGPIRSKRKKIFSDDDGEYVDFEEIKDER